MLRFLCERFPNLGSVIIEVANSFAEIGWFVGNATRQVVALLQEGRLDVVRFFSVGSAVNGDLYDFFHQIECGTQRVLEVVEEDVSHTSWKLLGAARVVRITQRRDVVLASEIRVE